MTLLKPRASGAVALGLVFGLAAGGAGNALAQSGPHPGAAVPQNQITQSHVQAKEGCDETCVRLIAEGVKLAVRLAEIKYKHDVAQCEQSFAPETPEIKACFNQAGWRTAKLLGVGVIGVPLAVLAHFGALNFGAFDRTVNRIMGGTKTDPIESVENPPVPDMRYTTPSGRIARAHIPDVRRGAQRGLRV
ncbi:MAG: hypothetical protein KDJ49_08375 [Alphaproteobacteria bacterium]|nr:hypothetical protein [Alphaproteobacteria bacterium]USO07765.1 MAG: hypothetical protein H6866_00585 [Rhodospirillales bacterium]